MAALYLWALGIPHIVPMLGVYALMGATPEGAFFLMMGGLAATGGLVGFAQAFIISPWALLITPVSFVLGYAPMPWLTFLSPLRQSLSFGTIAMVTLSTSMFCVAVGQMLLWYVASRQGLR
jgi:hypothetical protein